jgi:hypothetical protein
MAFVELQLQTKNFLGLVGTQFQLNILKPPPIPGFPSLQFTAGGTSYQVSAINLSGQPQLHNDQNAQFYVWWTTAADPNYVTTQVNGKSTQISQDVVIRLAQLQKDANGNLIGQTDAGSFGFHIVFSMSAWVSDIAAGPILAPPHNVTVEMRGDSIQPQFNNPNLVAPLETILSYIIAFPGGGVQTINFQIPPNKKTNSPGFNFTVINAGIAADAQLSRIVFRAELGAGSEDSPTLWTQFYNGAIPDHLGSNQLSEFIDASTVKTLVQSQIWSSLNQSGDKLRLQGGVNVDWAPSNQTPILNFGFNADVINACKFAGGASDLDYDFTGNITLGLAQQPNKLSSATYIDWSINNKLDLAKCAAVVGLDLGLLTGFSGGSFGLYLFGLFFIVGFVGVFAIAAVYAPDLAPPTCVQISNHEMNCTFPVPLNFGNVLGPSTQVSFTQITGAADGLVLGGSFLLPLGVLSVQLRLDLAGKQLNGRGLRALQSPIPSLVAYINNLSL